MTFIDVLHWISVGMLLFYAAASIIKPKFVAQNLEYSLNTGRGISEFRILHGGFFLGLGVFALYANHPLVFQALGWSWVGAGVVRIPAYFLDKPTIPLSLMGLIAEIVLGIFLLV